MLNVRGVRVHHLPNAPDAGLHTHYSERNVETLAQLKAITPMIESAKPAMTDA